MLTYTGTHECSNKVNKFPRIASTKETSFALQFFLRQALWEEKARTVGHVGITYCIIYKGLLLYINSVINGPSMQQFLISSYDVIATECFGHATIIKWHAVYFCIDDRICYST
jgi:hypothetical protein